MTDGLIATPLPSLEAARELWSALAGVTPNPFSTWEWASAWWAVHGRGRPLRLLTLARPGEPPIALLPLYVAAGRPLEVLRLVGHGAADELSFVGDPAHGAAVWAWLRDELAPGALVLLERLPVTAGWERELTGRRLRHESSPALTMVGLDWERWLATRSANLRQQIRRRERSLRRDHGLQFELVEDPAELPGAMDDLVALHRARWGDRSAAFDPAHEALCRRFAALALERGWLRLWIAHAGGEPAAAWLGFRYLGADSYYQAGRAPRWDAHGLGFVLLAHTIRDAFEAGMGEYRFGLGGEAYKSRFSSHDEGVVTVVAGPGPVPALVAGAARAVRAAPQPLRAAAGRHMRA